MAEPPVEQLAFSRRRTRTYDAQNDPNALLTSLLQIICPAGTLVPTLLAAEPGNGWKICNGQALSKAAFPRLHAILGATFGDTADTFNLPDLRGRTTFGAHGSTGALMALGGAASVTLAVGNLPAHTHAITDAGHDHAFTGAEHGHTVTDPGHAHSAATDAPATGTAGASSAAAVAGDTGTATTGITVGNTTAAGTISTATTGISAGNTGDGESFGILPPFIAVNWMVRT